MKLIRLGFRFYFIVLFFGVWNSNDFKARHSRVNLYRENRDDYSDNMSHPIDVFDLFT